MFLCGKSVSYKIVEVAQLLITNGVNVNQKDEEDDRNALIFFITKDGESAADCLNRRTHLWRIKKRPTLNLLMQ